MRYLACDLGAESGRVMLGTLTEGRLALEEIHRFANVPLKADGSLHWDISRLFEELKRGLRKAAERRVPIASLSTDSWGVDYLLFDGAGKPLVPTFHYRDPRARKGVENAFARVDWKTIFGETGIQFMVLNTLYQLAAESPERLAQARLILGIGDGFNYLLSGQAVAEQSMASTFQLFDPRTRTWSDALIGRLGFPREIFPSLVTSGTPLGALRADVGQETGLTGTQVVASCSHDTGAAVAAVPASGGNWAYLSSGTWSLMGVELGEPIITDACRELNFTNEVGYGGSIRLLKNIIGLWLVQECRRDWAKHGQAYEYSELATLAAQSATFGALINPTDQRFLGPDDMPAKIAGFCRETNQPPPATPGATIRCVLESLALLYRRTLLQIEQLTGRNVDRLHVVGGGSRNDLLNQFTADALQIPIVAGPAEATAAGNVLVQALALGHLPSLKAARDIVRASTDLQTIEPGPAAPWMRAYARFSEWF
jgi:rhamnulokinase